MCGIVGIFNCNGEAVDGGQIEKMTAVIAHRGPDASGTFLDGPIGLGHRRLSIIDLETGDQPMQSAGRRFTVVYNGEIYNFRPLRDELRQKGYTFRTGSDTEVILALYELEGRSSFRRLSGMFAFALWDRERKQLSLVRDRSGMKPLYYARSSGQLVFASEIRAIVAAFPSLRELDNAAVNFYFSRQYIGGDATIFKGIKKIKPAHFLEVGSNGEVGEGRFWSLSPTEQCRDDFETAQEKTDSLLAGAVRSHLVSDVPVGVFLSGGLDSSNLLSYAVEASSTPLQTFSVGFGEDHTFNETASARKTAEYFGSVHHEIQVTEKELVDSLPHIISRMDQPLADYAMLPTYVMSRFASRHVKVVLSGEGADEVFGGYRRYHLHALFDMTGLGPLFRNILPKPAVFSETNRRKLLSGELFQPRRGLPQEQKMLQDKRGFSGAGALNSILYADFSNWLTDDLLMKVDSMGMLASLEARMPYLDHRLVEYVYSLPGHFKATIRVKKKLLRETAARHLPAEICMRPKHGFTVPVGEWLRGTLKDTFREVVLNDRDNKDWFDLPFVERRFQAHMSGKDLRLELWALLVFCLWKRDLRTSGP